MRARLLVLIAVVAAFAWVPRASAALIFDFSFTAATGTVTGEIDGLTDNAPSSATHVIIDSITGGAGVGLGITLPYDTISDHPSENMFTVTTEQITNFDYVVSTPDYTFDLVSPTNTTSTR